VLVEQHPRPTRPAQVEGRAVGQEERLQNAEVLAEAVARNLQLTPTPVAQEPHRLGRCELHADTAAVPAIEKKKKTFVTKAVASEYKAVVLYETTEKALGFTDFTLCEQNAE
jgi:hypothetical protein